MHKLIGTLVRVHLPVLVKAGFRKLNENDPDQGPEEVPAQYDMQEFDAHVIGIDRRIHEEHGELVPAVHVSYLNPKKTHHLDGAGWRDAFDKVDSIRPVSDPLVEEMLNKHEPIAFYESDDTYRELRMLQQKAAADAKQKADEDAAAAAAADAAKKPPLSASASSAGAPGTAVPADGVDAPAAATTADGANAAPAATAADPMLEAKAAEPAKGKNGGKKAPVVPSE